MKEKMIILPLKNTFDSKDKALVISFISILTGLIAGVLIYGLTIKENNNELYKLFIDFNINFTHKKPAEIFSGFALTGLVYFLIMFVSGSSLFGKLLCPVMTFLKAMGITLITSQLYTSFGLKGFEYGLLIFFPGKIILLFSMLILTKLSIDCCSGIFSGESLAPTKEIKNYCIKSMLILILFILSWIMDLICILIFTDLFNF